MVVKSKDSPKSLSAIFGEVKYKRTYYENKRTGEYRYLSDELLGIEAHDKIDTSLKARLVKEAIDSPYRKSGAKASDSIDLTEIMIKYVEDEWEGNFYLGLESIIE